MQKIGITMHRRVNVTLPEATLRLIDRVAKRGSRSRFINEAVEYFAHTQGKEKLREELREGALKRAKRDLGLVQDWFILDEEAWQKGRR